MSKILILSVLIQSLGTLSSFALLAVIARFGGPLLQGEYASLKAWIDFMVVIGQFGIPQGFIYVVNKGLADRKNLPIGRPDTPWQRPWARPSLPRLPYGAAWSP
ncbi:hypothetical protein PSQ19_11050 [Devosia algicola]|uniref:Polysaccharide biosynthesis protein n=1 Tax=Devosia algicola TaxID=3026418 RepID=A0ABY7YJK9_9HYPH|nr:hypothetical protein [Devosia algicola]WDR01363.1 hypothetical protein PSQ19_11050 [Devosia algicola]